MFLRVVTGSEAAQHQSSHRTHRTQAWVLRRWPLRRHIPAGTAPGPQGVADCDHVHDALDVRSTTTLDSIHHNSSQVTSKVPSVRNQVQRLEERCLAGNQLALASQSELEARLRSCCRLVFKGTTSLVEGCQARCHVEVQVEARVSRFCSCLVCSLIVDSFRFVVSIASAKQYVRQIVMVVGKGVDPRHQTQQ
jgi:hypothetical protein